MRKASPSIAAFAALAQAAIVVQPAWNISLKKAFEYAKANGFDKVTSVLGFSRYKDFDQVNRAALSVGGKDLYDTTNWRKNGLQELASELNKELSLYNQNYCGCKPRESS